MSRNQHYSKRAKEVLVRWMGGENLDIAAMEMARLIKEYTDKAVLVHWLGARGIDLDITAVEMTELVDRASDEGFFDVSGCEARNSVCKP